MATGKRSTYSRCCLYTAALAACCSGCTTAPMEPAKVPIPIRCIEQMPKRPELLPDRALIELQDGRLVLALREQQLLLRLYAAELEAVMQPCLR